jgi:hypothetical protein
MGFKRARLHVVLDPETLMRIDDYRHQRRFSGHVSARASSKSDAIRTLIRLGLEKQFSPEHIDIIERVNQEQASRTPQERTTLIGKYPAQRTHIAIEQEEVLAIDWFKWRAKFDSREDTIKYLLRVALEGRFPSDHLNIVENLAAEKEIRDIAHHLWEAEGRPEAENEKLTNDRWFRARSEFEARVVAETAERPESATVTTTPERLKPG